MRRPAWVAALSGVETLLMFTALMMVNIGLVGFIIYEILLVLPK